MPLDKFNLVLLKSLQQNCHTPLRELSEVVHLSTASVQRRVQKLKEEGYIQSNVAVLQPNKLDKVITILVEVKVEKTQTTDLHFLKESFSGPEIQQCYYVTGEADFVLVLLVPNMERFQEICDTLFHDNPNVKSFRTMVALDRVKVSLDVL